MSAVAKVPAVEAVAEAETAAAPAAVSPAAALEGEAAAAAAPSEPCGQEPTAKQPSSSDDSKKKKKSIQNGTTGRLLKACAQGKLEEAQAAVREGVRWGEAVTRNGAGPLHLAAFGGHLELIQWLADKCALPVSARDRSGGQPIHPACFNGQLEVVKWLHTRGAALSAADDRGDTPLHHACLGGHASVVRWLLWHGADPSVKSVQGLTAAQIAKQAGKDGCVTVVENYAKKDGGTQQADAKRLKLAPTPAAQPAPTQRTQQPPQQMQQHMQQSPYGYAPPQQMQQMQQAPYGYARPPQMQQQMPPQMQQQMPPPQQAAYGYAPQPPTSQPPQPPQPPQQPPYVAPVASRPPLLPLHSFQAPATYGALAGLLQRQLMGPSTTLPAMPPNGGAPTPEQQEAWQQAYAASVAAASGVEGALAAAAVEHVVAEDGTIIAVNGEGPKVGVTPTQLFQSYVPISAKQQYEAARDHMASEAMKKMGRKGIAKRTPTWLQSTTLE